MHAVVEALGVGPVEMFASSGGAVTALALVAAFIAMTSKPGELTDDYFAQPAPDPAQFGMPTEDDGSRDDPMLSDRSWAVSSYRLDRIRDDARHGFPCRN